MYQEGEIKHGEVVDNLLRKEREEGGDEFTNIKGGKWKAKYHKLRDEVEKMKRLKKVEEQVIPLNRWQFMKNKINKLEKEKGVLKMREVMLKNEKNSLSTEGKKLKEKNKVLKEEKEDLNKRVQILL